ncbi:hypothetical protein Btru_047709 [Bulinus truncatus]|nr:hypothetical protein Btru_047709 [Bulinus truncatus]
MAHSRRKNDVTTKGGLSPTRSVRRIFYRELKVYDVEMEEDSEQILLSPTESELICPVDKPFLNIVGSLEKRNMSLKGRKSGSLGGFPSSPKAVSSLMNVVPSSSTAVRESKGKSKKQAADKHKLDLLEDPFSFQISEFDSSDNIILRLPTKGTVGKSSPDTLANLVRLAMRRGLLGPYFRGLAYEDPSKLMMWQSEFLDAQSTGSEPPIDALGNPDIRPVET